MHIEGLTFQMAYEVIRPIKDCIGEDFRIGERLTFKQASWSPHDGWHMVIFEERSMALDPQADRDIVQGIEDYLQAVGMAQTIIAMTLADFRPGVVLEVTNTFVDSNRSFFKTAERLRFLDQAFDEAADQHTVRFEDKTMKLWRGHDVSLHAERFFRVIE